MTINTGILESDRRAAANQLSTLLADTYSLFLKTQNFHWNVSGPSFHSLHLLFETQYRELLEAVDEIAERIRALGFHTPATYRDFMDLTSISDPQGAPMAREMIMQLVEDNEIVIRTARSAFSTVERAGDDASVDLLAKRLRDHEKAAWMLRSFLEDSQVNSLSEDDDFSSDQDRQTA